MKYSDHSVALGSCGVVRICVFTHEFEGYQ